MIVLPCKQTTFLDVDDTLVKWSPSQEELDRFGIWIECPGSAVCDVDGSDMGYAPAWKTKLVPHRRHVLQLKKHKMRGHTVIVWSAGGWDWAEAVVKALQLEQYVDLVISKPLWAYDDKKAAEYMPESCYLKDYAADEPGDIDV